MRTRTSIFFGFMIQMFSICSLSGQIHNEINAHIPHRFIVENKTLPPGDYTFRMESGTDLGVMTVRDAKSHHVAQFSVRESIDDHTPKHSELVFKKYGDIDFLSKIYEGGNKIGVAVSDNSRKEVQMMGSGQQASEHTEEQQ